MDWNLYVYILMNGLTTIVGLYCVTWFGIEIFRALRDIQCTKIIFQAHGAEKKK